MACIYKSGTDTCTSKWDYCGFDDTSQCAGYKPSNADRIRSLSDEELAEWIADDLIEPGYNTREQTVKMWLNWLREEAKDD